MHCTKCKAFYKGAGVIYAVVALYLLFAHRERDFFFEEWLLDVHVVPYLVYLMLCIHIVCNVSLFKDCAVLYEWCISSGVVKAALC